MQFNLVLSEHLVALVNRFATPSSLRDIRYVSFCFLAFAGFLCFDDLKVVLGALTFLSFKTILRFTFPKLELIN